LRAPGSGEPKPRCASLFPGTSRGPGGVRGVDQSGQGTTACARYWNRSGGSRSHTYV
jgi:hypothetical protein